RQAGPRRADAAERSHLAALPGHRAGDRSGDHERAARRGDDDRRERSARVRDACGTDVGRDEEIRAAAVDRWWGGVSPYPTRSAVSGPPRAARRAGPRQATAATAAMTIGTPMNVSASWPLMP